MKYDDDLLHIIEEKMNWDCIQCSSNECSKCNEGSNFTQCTEEKEYAELEEASKMDSWGS